MRINTLKNSKLACPVSALPENKEKINLSQLASERKCANNLDLPGFE